MLFFTVVHSGRPRFKRRDQSNGRHRRLAAGRAPAASSAEREPKSRQTGPRRPQPRRQNLLRICPSPKQINHHSPEILSPNRPRSSRRNGQRQADPPPSPQIRAPILRFRARAAGSGNRVGSGRSEEESPVSPLRSEGA